WTALILLLARRDPRKAEAELQAARAKLPPDRLRRVLGPAYEALGRLEQAEEAHRAALAASPDDPLVLRDAFRFHARLGRKDRAEPCLRRLLGGRVKASAAQVACARRWLAVLLASGGNYRQFREAQSLLEQNAGEGPEAALEDQRARALVLATRPEHRRQAL